MFYRKRNKRYLLKKTDSEFQLINIENTIQIPPHSLFAGLKNFM